MKALTKTIAIATSAIVLLLACRSLFAAQDDELAVTDKFKNFEASKMFSIPTADVIGSKDIALEAAKGSSNLFNAKIGLGLGDVAEVTTSLSQIKTDLKNKDAHMTSSLKVKAFDNKGWRPALAFMISKSIPDSIRSYRNDERVAYSINTTDFYALLKNNAEIGGHDVALNYGLRVSDSRIANGDDAEAPTSKMQAFPVVGLKVQTNSTVTTMMEYEQAPYYRLADGARIDLEHIVHGGVRFFITSWMALNAGAKYKYNAHDTRKEESGLANTELLLKLNMNIPTNLLFKRLGNQVKN